VKSFCVKRNTLFFVSLDYARVSVIFVDMAERITAVIYKNLFTELVSVSVAGLLESLDLRD
jgi:hypothetical protein